MSRLRPWLTTSCTAEMSGLFSAYSDPSRARRRERSRRDRKTCLLDLLVLFRRDQHEVPSHEAPLMLTLSRFRPWFTTSCTAEMSGLFSTYSDPSRARRRKRSRRDRKTCLLDLLVLFRRDQYEVPSHEAPLMLTLSRLRPWFTTSCTAEMTGLFSAYSDPS